MGELARLLIYGDIHLNSKNYGAHNNYPKESLGYFKEITKKTIELKATHLIGLGDFTFGRFHTLEYRGAVEEELNKQNEAVNGNRFEIKGNHDSATYGMTEYEYYIKKGLLKPRQNLKIGNVNISMVNYGGYNEESIIDPTNGNEINVVLAHDFFKFSDTMLPEYGKAILLDNFTPWFGVDYLIVGHVHNIEMFEGLSVKDGHGHRMVVHYPGCMSRPSYREGAMNDHGEVVLLTIFDNGEMKYDIIDIPLLPLEESFNIDKKALEKERKEEKEKRVDISDIVIGLNNHQRSVGNPEDIIEAMNNVDEKYKKKAIELLKAGQS